MGPRGITASPPAVCRAVQGKAMGTPGPMGLVAVTPYRVTLCVLKPEVLGATLTSLSLWEARVLAISSLLSLDRLHTQLGGLPSQPVQLLSAWSSACPHTCSNRPLTSALRSQVLLPPLIMRKPDSALDYSPQVTLRGWWCLPPRAVTTCG